MSKGGGQGSFAQMQQNSPSVLDGSMFGTMEQVGQQQQQAEQQFNQANQGAEGFGFRSTGMPSPKLGTGTMFSGGNPNFDERTGQFRTGGFKPPRVPAPPQQPVIDFNSGPRAGYRPPNPNVSSGIGGKGGRGMTGIVAGGMDPTRGFPNDRVYAGGNPNFDERMGRYRSPQYDPRPPFMPGPRPPVFGPPRPAPGRNTQFQMPFFGSPYGRMNPYQGQFSGYGVPTNIASFAQPHYQPYVPRSYEPPPPSMQLPPGQGDPSLNYPQNQGDQLFSGGGFRGGYGGYGGIGGFGRYNLGLAGSQFR